MALTYTYNIQSTDPTILAISQTRLKIGDTNVSGPDGPQAIWNDQELTDWLNLVGWNPELAGAKALRSAATDAAKIAWIVRIGEIINDETEPYKAILAVAAALELDAVVAPVVATDQQMGFYGIDCAMR